MQLITDIDNALKECDDQQLILKRLKRRLESQQRILAAERKAKVRKIIQHNYKYELADVCQTLIDRGIIDESLRVL